MLAGGAARGSALSLSSMSARHASHTHHAPARCVSALVPVSCGLEYEGLPTLNRLSRVKTSKGSQQEP